jgi:LDH2 family malate/lactate/ureidoglycolate dehydrogenase
MRPDLFRDLDDFKQEMDRQLREMRAAGEPGQVQIPGETALRLEMEQRRDGVEVPEPLLDELRQVARRLGVPDDLTD